jgi:hypothetical protein
VLEIAHHPRVLRRVFQAGVFNGFYFDFVQNPTGVAIASISSDVTLPPTTSASQGTSAARPTWNSAGYASFDGSDDNLLTTLAPVTSGMTLALCGRMGTNQIAMGCDGVGGNARCYIGLNGSNLFGMGWGAESFATIAGGSALNGLDFVGLARANGSVVETWVNGARTYQNSPSGSPTISVGMCLGAYNNGSFGASAFVNGRIYRVAAVPRFIPDNMVVPLMRELGRGVVSF